MACMQFEQLGVPRVQVERAVAVRRPQRHPARLQEPRRPPLAAGAGAQVRRSTTRGPGNGICHYVHIERFASPAGSWSGPTRTRPTSGALRDDRDRRRRPRRRRARWAATRSRSPCPEVVGVHLEGELPRPWVQAKDIILELLRRLSVSGGKNKVFEFTGPGHGRPVGPRARHDREHDRRARRDRRRSSRPTTRRATGCGASSARTTSSRSAPTTAATTTRASRSTSPSSGRSSRSPRTPTTSSRSRRSPARRGRAGVHRLVASTRPTWTSRSPAPCWPTRAASSCTKRVTATATPGSRQILVAIAESGVYRQLVEGGVRMLEPVCGPCVGMGQAPPSDANSLRTFNRNFPGRSGTPERLGLPVLAGGRGGLAAARRDPRPARVRRPARAARRARAEALRRRRPHLRPGRPRTRPTRIEIPRGPNIKPPPEHAPLPDSVERADRDRPAGQHLDRRPRARRRRS